MKKLLSIILLCSLMSVFSGVAAYDPVRDVGITKVEKNVITNLVISNDQNISAEFQVNYFLQQSMTANTILVKR